MSPARPRQHQLETESENYFRTLVPSTWVVRRPDDDYGIDLEVELFKGGLATGLTFKVQLKATDAAFADQPWVAIEVASLVYWRHLDVPVLLVRYDANQRRAHGRWAHTLKFGDGETQRVRFSDDDLLTAESAAGFGETTEIFRALRAGRLTRPLALSLSVDESAPPPFADAPLRAALRRLTRESAGFLRITPPSAASAGIAISQRRLLVSLPISLATFSFDLSVYSKIDAKAIPESVASDCLAALAVLLTRINAHSQALRLVALVGPRTFIWSDPDAAQSLADALHVESQPYTGLALARPLLASADEASRDAGYRLLMPAVRHLGLLSEGQRAELIQTRSAAAAAEEASSRPRRAGTAHYNLGQLYAGLKRWDEAVTAYQRAATWDPNYEARDYWHSEQAGYLFELGRYAESAAAYQRAVAITDDERDLLPLWADALIYAGSYEQALHLLETAPPPSVERLADLARLDRVLAEVLVHVCGISTQARSPSGMVPENWESGDSFHGYLAAHDGLDPRPWLVRLRQLDPDVAHREMISIALMLRGDPAAWAAATLAVLLEEAVPDLRRSVIRHGLRHGGDEYRELMAQFSEPLDGGSAITDYVEEVDRGVAEEVAPFTARVVFDPEELKHLLDGADGTRPGSSGIR